MRKIIILGLCGLFFTSLLWGQKTNPDLIKFQSNRSTDSLALVAFNINARGELWKEKWDFSQPMDEWFGVTLNADGRVFCLDLDGEPDCTAKRFGGNHLHGHLVDLQLPCLEHLFLSSNQLEGEIPNFSRVPYLLTLQLSANRLEGCIPELNHLQHLVKLDLEYNQLSGQIPKFEFLKNVESVYLGHNQLSGSVPTFDYSEKLKHLFINNNHLNGRLNALDHLTELKLLILAKNQLQGKIPSFENNQNLKLVDLSDNDFECCILPKNYDHIPQFDYTGNSVGHCDEMEWSIPNAISPNGDGKNDYFRIGYTTGQDLPFNIELLVWNSTKGMVYHSTDYQNDWDGTLMGQGTALEPGVYMYQLKMETGTVKTGWLLVK